jgi:fructose-1,6-bisphosphatase/inositol monophosphatase family enzyme
MLHFQKESKNGLIRVLGCIALELCLVAEGALDAVVDVRALINGYDIAGASLIVKEAGGMITDLEGDEFGTEVGETERISLIAALEPEIYQQMRGMMV